MLIDTGAPENAAGEEWIARVTADQGTESWVTWTPYQSQLHGIGQGAAVCHNKAEIPIGLEPNMNTTFKTQVLSGCGARVPGLLGLDSLIKRRAIIDLSDERNEQCYNLHFCDAEEEWQTLRIEKVNGHLILPIDNYPSASNLPLPSKEQFSSDPLGLNTWYCDTDVNETYVVEPDVVEHHNHHDNLTDNAQLLATGMSPNSPRTPSGNPVVSPALHFAPLLATGTSSNPPRTPSGDPVVSQAQNSTATTIHPSTQSTHTVNVNTPHYTSVPAEQAHCQKENWGESSKHFAHFEPSTHKFGNSQFPYKNTPDTDSQNIMKGTYSVLKRIKSTAKHLKILAGSAPYQRKYRGLPLGTPIPEIPSKYMDLKQWDFWEWWAGKSGLTNAVAKEGLTTGPPVTHETGWCLKLATHRKRLLELLLEKRPKVLFGAPTCAPWSRACTTMNPQLKALIRAEELEVFEFWIQATNIQCNDNRDYIYEQPRSSELLSQPEALNHKDKTNATDQVTCMCMHDLKDPENGKPYMKQTTLRGTITLRKAIVYCNNKHQHQMINGRLKSGLLRTQAAQAYTPVFCKRLARDIKNYIQNRSAYPFDIDEVALDDPYQAEETNIHEEDNITAAQRRAEQLREERKAQANPMPATPQRIDKPYLQPTAKRSSAPKTPNKNDEDIIQDVRLKARNAENTAQPFNDLTEQWDKEETDRQIKEIDRATANRTEGYGGSEPSGINQPKPIVTSDKSDPIKDLQIDGDGNPTPDPPAPLVLRKDRPILTENIDIINSVWKPIEQKLARSGQYTLQTGPRMKLFQSTFGAPSNKIILAVTFMKKPQARSPPEPLLSRQVAPLFLELELKKGTWNVSVPWTQFTHCTYAKKPEAVIIMHGRDCRRS